VAEAEARSPDSHAAACTLEARPSLRRMCCTWIFTVASAMPRARAISLLLSPRATSSSVSRSRTDSDCSTRVASPCSGVSAPGTAGRVSALASGSAPLAASGPAPARRKAEATLAVIVALMLDWPAAARTIEAPSSSLSTVLSR